MVPNGYILNVSTAELPAFLHRVRFELKEFTRDAVLNQIAKAAETLFDMKFLELRKYEQSIFDQALGIVAGRISGVALGAFKDDRLDFRANLVIAKCSEDGEKQYVLLNTDNPMIRYWWEELDEVLPFKYDSSLDEDDPEYADNNERGTFWHDIFTASGWNIHLTGYAAQLSVQPNIEQMNITVDELRDRFTDPEIRSGDYVKNAVIIGKVRELVGNTPIEKITPYTMLDFFQRGIGYAESAQGRSDAMKLYQKVGEAFRPVILDSLTLCD